MAISRCEQFEFSHSVSTYNAAFRHDYVGEFARGSSSWKVAGEHARLQGARIASIVIRLVSVERTRRTAPMDSPLRFDEGADKKKAARGAGAKEEGA